MTGLGRPVLVASDLDRTLIYSARALALPEGSGTDLVCVEHHEGREVSYMTRRAAGLLARLAIAAEFVPATTRTTSQLARVRLPIPRPRYAVAANGGVLLVDGVPDRGWGDQVARAVAASSEPMDAVWRDLSRIAGAHPGCRLYQAERLFCYGVLPDADTARRLAGDLPTWAEAAGWRVDRQGRKVYVLPRQLTKSSAVAEVARRAGATRTFAAGDSVLDVGMLGWADAGIQPAHAALAPVRAGTGNAVTKSVGVCAGEEILTWLLDAAVAEPAA